MYRKGPRTGDSWTATVVQGLPTGGHFNMIDDDFESVFRRMFEHLMKSMGPISDGEGTISYWSGSTIGNSDVGGMYPPSNEVNAEVIDLEDRVLFLVEMENDGTLVDVKVEKRTLRVNDQIEGNERVFDLDFDVDIDNSRVSLRNGILEIALKKATSDDGPKEGYLRIE
jgi:HSP20 family molecular chaperone IbpA